MCGYLVLSIFTFKLFMLNSQESFKYYSIILFFFFSFSQTSFSSGSLNAKASCSRRPHARLLVSQAQRASLTKKFRSSGLLTFPLCPVAADTVRDDELLQ